MQSNFSGGSNLGNTVTAAGSANTKGTYTQLIASTNFEVRGIWVAVFQSGLTDATDNRMLLDIAKGPAGSEVVIIPNLLAGHHSNAWHSPLGYYPLLVAAGTRIAARVQAAVASRATQVGIWLFGTPADPSNAPAVATGIEARGVNIANSGGAAVTVGASGAEGSWASLGTVAADAHGAVFLTGLGGDTAAQSGGWTMDFGRGAGGAQTVIEDDFYLRTVATGDYHSPTQPTYQPQFNEDLPTGTELWARASSALATPDSADAAAYVFTGYAPAGGGGAGLTISAAYQIFPAFGATGDVTNRADSGPATYHGVMTNFYEVSDKPEVHVISAARRRKSRW